MKSLKPITHWAQKHGLSKSFGRALRRAIPFGEKWGQEWFSTEAQFAEVLARYKENAERPTAGVPRKKGGEL